jgi:hypothetical protein
VSRAQRAFEEKERRRKRSFGFVTSWLPTSLGKRAAPEVAVVEQLSELYEKQCPKDYKIETQVQSFYSNRDYWERFREWERTRESYSIRDKEFVESSVKIDGADVVNIGCFYPWAEIEWGSRVSRWTAIDINPGVLQSAREALGEYTNHKVTFRQQDITSPFYLGRRVDCVLDLSTGDQLDPRKLWNVLCNYIRLSDHLVMAYDATNEDPAVFDFQHYGFNALYNPATMSSLLTAAGYKILDHRSFRYENRSYISARLATRSVLRVPHLATKPTAYTGAL